MAPFPAPGPARGGGAGKAPPRAPAEIRALARSPRASFLHGMIATTPFLIVVVPFALLFGVMSQEAGMDLAQTMGFSILVFAGASQFTAVQLISDQAPALLVIMSGLAVNLRMAMYSASLVPWLRGASAGKKVLIAYLLIDQSFALSLQHYERHPRLTLPQRLAYFFGSATLLCLPWSLATWAGATLGRAIPDDIALDFAMPITFLAMIAPMLRTPAHLAACGVAIVLALVFAGLPSGLGLMIAALAGMATGALVETVMERGKATQG